MYFALPNGAAFDTWSVWSPLLSDTNGWNHPMYYTTIRLADVNGDRRDDLCARDSEGFNCYLSTGTRFDTRVQGPR